MMSSESESAMRSLIEKKHLTDAERNELTKLGILNAETKLQEYTLPDYYKERSPIKKRAVQAPNVLNEAHSYSPRPSSFSRALCLELGDYRVLLISGTASVDEDGRSIYEGDFRTQCWRTYRNITELLKAEQMTWHDVVRTSCYLRDMSRDYKEFNEIRTAFFQWLGLNPLPASTGIQALICREDLLVEIEAIALAQIK